MFRAPGCPLQCYLLLGTGVAVAPRKQLTAFHHFPHKTPVRGVERSHYLMACPSRARNGDHGAFKQQHAGDLGLFQHTVEKFRKSHS